MLASQSAHIVAVVDVVDGRGNLDVTRQFLAGRRRPSRSPPTTQRVSQLYEVLTWGQLTRALIG